ncbi:MAG: hypothetical protein KBE04_05875 [Phycisphaerae bacterium]|nr:hypothetical protein [Phycisphaerae bacterium]
MWFKIFILVALPALAIAWGIYFYWQWRLDQEEKNQPKKVSTHLQKSRGEVADWAQKMASYKPPKPPPRPDDDADGSPS